MSDDLEQISRFLSLVLRHDPGAVGLVLDPQGWVGIADLVAAAPMPLTRETIIQTVATSDKQRFAISDDGLRVRANQGHSVTVDLQLQPVPTPPVLYHGTATRFLDAILADGLTGQSRQHVHLSADTDQAIKVGQRHGKALVLGIDCTAMTLAGHRFFQAANGVWLTDAVPPRFLSILPG